MMASSSIKGDPDHPINQGWFISKGATMFQLQCRKPETHEIEKTRSSDQAIGSPSLLEEVEPMGAAIQEIACKTMNRDAGFVETEEVKGSRPLTVNRCAGHREPRRLPGELRGGIPHPEGDALAGHHRHRQPGACLTRPHRRRSGGIIRSRLNDYSLVRHAKHRCHHEHRLQLC